ncbi:hypothetical protein [Oligoflexus tunisiensis]|uniref:hypothetical protein n=1 Tax=Oligoflexus tunisiensis TaxID=708132 RepID=UPI00114D1094|nr:hypothetical protein [Oligoflexus tunisiensis]
MKQLIAIISLSWASLLWAQDDNIGNETDLGHVAAEPAEHFDILQLPKGASVVLPHPASTLVPLNVKVRVTATDRKQILKIGAISSNGSTKAVNIAVYDRYQPRVKYVSIRPGGFVLYSFKNLNTLQLVPQNSKDPGLRQTRLLLESNRPMGVGY